MAHLHELTQKVSRARQSFIATASGLNFAQASFKIADDAWSVTENTEHMVWAEMGGINGMWKIAGMVRRGTPLYKGELTHKGLSIEEIVSKTWASKEQAPEIARPKWGGELDFWLLSLASLQPMLEKLIDSISDLDPTTIIHPHPISGPLDVVQRLEFLRFHLNRHEEQIRRIKSHSSFPR